MRRICATVLVLFSCIATAAAQSQPRSQLAVLAQNVGAGRVEITWRRPVARGRDLFGAVVPFGKVWTPSADSAARITFSGPVEINGASLAAGTYSVWSIPDSTSWTLIFSSAPAVHHMRYPDGRDVLRVSAVPTKGEHVETLSFTFPMVDADSALLQIRWGTTVVPLMIRAK